MSLFLVKLDRPNWADESLTGCGPRHREARPRREREPPHIAIQLRNGMKQVLRDKIGTAIRPKISCFYVTYSHSLGFTIRFPLGPQVVWRK